MADVWVVQSRRERGIVRELDRIEFSPLQGIGSSRNHASETSVDNHLTTRQYIPEESELHTRRRDNLKSHISL
jgi:hypothetical protein